MNIESKKAEVMLSESGFNNCPPRSHIVSLLLRGSETTKVEVIDLLDRSFWTNDEATLVFSMVEGEDADFARQNFVRDLDVLKADEIQQFKSNGRVFIRAWWD